VRRGVEELHEPRLFAVSGRMGRIRYLSNVTGVYLLGMLVVGVLAAGVSSLVGRHGMVPIYGVMAVGYGGVLVLWFMLAIQRLHDIDQRGWLSLLWLIPFINIVFFGYLIFMPGDKEPNRFGPPTTPNSMFSVIIACLLPAIMLLAILFTLTAMSGYRSWR